MGKMKALLYNRMSTYVRNEGVRKSPFCNHHYYNRFREEPPQILKPLGKSLLGSRILI